MRLPLSFTLLGFLLFSACEKAAPPPRVVREDRIDQPLRGASADERERFTAGDVAFDAVHSPSDGLGPLYIRTACGSCHDAAGRGPGSVEKMAVPEGSPDAALPYGHTVRPYLAAGAKTPIAPPTGGWVTGAPVSLSLRTGPAIWGRGYLEAIDGAEIERQEAAQAARDDGVHGRVNRVTFHSIENPDTRFGSYALGTTGLIGRFGYKARVATLDDFTADALQGDMGLTSPLRPVELPNPDGLLDDDKPGVDVELSTVNAIADYLRLVEIPARDPAPASERARALFSQVRCDACHVPSLRTRADYPVAALAGIDAKVYTDLLLHDMGDALADGVPDETSTGREWRTAPLIGLRFFRAFLHDGRAHSVREAIAAHAGNGSQANDSVGRFDGLGADNQETLVRFVESL